MMLLHRVAEIERQMQDTGLAEVALVWSDKEELVDREELRPGQYVALDVRVDEPARNYEREDVTVAQWRVKERITHDPGDMGGVYDADGLRVGRVTAVDGGLVDIEYGGDDLLEQGSALGGTAQ